MLIRVLVLNAQICDAGSELSVNVWVSSEDMTKKLIRIEQMTFIADDSSLQPTIRVNATQTYQSILGLGSSFEHTTCFNISRLDAAKREEVIESLVNPHSGIGMNLMRICIGTPDFTGEPWYSYDDMPSGETDLELKNFSIAKDMEYIIPVLKIALKENPELLFFASPWSPPGWMTSSGDMIGGNLLPNYYSVYVNYFVKFVKAYENEEIPIYAVTIQNEPGVDRGKGSPKWYYPSCQWSGEQERNFIKNFLGPAFRENGIKTKIWCYDHNFNVKRSGDDSGLSHPRAVLSDPEAARYVNGTAFHHYAGTPDGMSLFHTEFPDKHIYFTEGSVFRTSGAIRLIDYLRNWSRSYNAWVTMIDNQGKPNNGPFRASRTCIMLNNDDLTVNYYFDYYMFGQFMKFVKRGAVRIFSDEGTKEFANIAFKNPDGTIVLVVANAGTSPKQFKVLWNGQMIKPTMDAKSVATYMWDPN